MQFSKESIDLILSGVKTQTRRPVKRCDTIECHPARAATISHDLGHLQAVSDGAAMYEAARTAITPGLHVSPARCSEPDSRDIQYARVRFLKAAADGTCINVELDGDEGVSTVNRYRWKWRLGNTYAVCPGRGVKQVARIRLTGIKCERVGDISDEDAMAEGVVERVWDWDVGTTHLEYAFSIKGKEFVALDASGAFIQAWGYLYPKAHPDDLVWALTFELEERDQ